jgi:hypothetical protein
MNRSSLFFVLRIKVDTIKRLNSRNFIGREDATKNEGNA